MSKQLSSQLVDLITQKKTEVLRVLNGELICLFWEIGKDASKEPISKEIAKRLGAYASVSNINAMVNLYRRFPDLKEVKYISSLIGWDQLKLLLQQESDESLKFYLWLTVDKGLTAPALKREIAKDQRLKNTGKNYLNRLVQMGLDRQQKGISAVPDLISQPLFRKLPHARLNASLNMLLWNIGKLINDALVDDNTINEVSNKLVAKFGKTFMVKNLLQFCRFHKDVPDINHATRLAYLLPFNYIAALLSLPGIEEKLYYARAAITENIGISDLRKRIAANGNLSKVQLQKEYDLIGKMKSPATRKNANITRKYVDFGDDLHDSRLVRRVFKQACFRDLFLK